MHKRRSLRIILTVGVLFVLGAFAALAYGNKEKKHKAEKTEHHQGHKAAAHKSTHDHAHKHGTAAGHSHEHGHSHGHAAGGTMPPKPVHVARTTYGEVKPAVKGGPNGLVGVRQLGKEVKADIYVHGLKPNTVHAAHVHGPNAGCGEGQFTDRHALEFEDLKADENGNAVGHLTMKVDEQIVGKRGYFVMVHENPTPADHGHHMGGPIPKTNPPGPKNPKIGCADIPRW